MEQNVRLSGAVPATIGLIGGRIKVGLERKELERLADPAGKSVKLSRRDIAAAVALGKDGGTMNRPTPDYSRPADGVPRHHMQLDFDFLCDGRHQGTH